MGARLLFMLTVAACSILVFCKGREPLRQYRRLERQDGRRWSMIAKETGTDKYWYHWYHHLYEGMTAAWYCLPMGLCLPHDVPMFPPHRPPRYHSAQAIEIPGDWSR